MKFSAHAFYYIDFAAFYFLCTLNTAAAAVPPDARLVTPGLPLILTMQMGQQLRRRTSHRLYRTADTAIYRRTGYDYHQC